MSHSAVYREDWCGHGQRSHRDLKSSTSQLGTTSQHSEEIEHICSVVSSWSEGMRHVEVPEKDNRTYISVSSSLIRLQLEAPTSRHQIECFQASTGYFFNKVRCLLLPQCTFRGPRFALHRERSRHRASSSLLPVFPRVEENRLAPSMMLSGVLWFHNLLWN